MSVDWFRSWHGAPTDPKWLVIARRANVRPIDVSAFAWALLDHASQAADRGIVGDFDFETYSALMGVEETEARSIYAAMEHKGVIISGRLARWERRQPKREDSSAERMAKSRRKPDEPDLPLETAPERPPPAPPNSARESIAEEPGEPEPAPLAAAEPIIITPQAIQLADDIAVIAGHKLEFVPPNWCGAATRVEMWIDRGWSPPLILESVKAQMVRKRDGPPDTIRYFEKGIARAHADREQPLPIVQSAPQETIHARPRYGSNRGGFHRLSRALAEGEGADGAAGNGNAACLRLVDRSGNS